MLSTIHFECLLVPEQLVGWPLSSEQLHFKLRCARRKARCIPDPCQLLSYSQRSDVGSARCSRPQLHENDFGSGLGSERGREADYGGGRPTR